jgi:hypothetical protein
MATSLSALWLVGGVVVLARSRDSRLVAEAGGVQGQSDDVRGGALAGGHVPTLPSRARDRASRSLASSSCSHLVVFFMLRDAGLCLHGGVLEFLLVACYSLGKGFSLLAGHLGCGLGVALHGSMLLGVTFVGMVGVFYVSSEVWALHVCGAAFTNIDVVTQNSWKKREQGLRAGTRCRSSQLLRGFGAKSN